MGISRKLKRNQAKTEHRKFSESWRKEKAYQLFLLGQGEELPSDTPKLGRKPTFNMWSKIAKTEEARKIATPEDVQDFQNESINLEWDDDKPNI